MKHAACSLSLGLVLALLLLLSGCGSPPASRTTPSEQIVVAISISESYVTLGAGEGHQFTAIVNGPSNTAVNWSISGCSGTNCGSISSTGYYTAPASVPAPFVTEVVATSQANTGKSASAYVKHEPVALSLAPTGAWVSPGETRKFTADIHYDIDQKGVIWSLTCPGTICGTLVDETTTSVVYTAPTGLPTATIATLKATSVRDTNRSNSVNINVKLLSSPTVLDGDYAFLFDGWNTRCSPSGCDGSRTALAGQFHADGKGHITSGVEDINIESDRYESLAISGSYEVEDDLRGTLTLTSSNGTANYRMSIAASGRQGSFVTFHEGSVDGLVLGSGFFERQDPTAFSSRIVAGPYAVGLFGDWNRAAVGRFEANAAGVLSNGRLDLQRNNGLSLHGAYVATHNLSGTLSAPSATTGRGSATLTFLSTEGGTSGSLKFAYYVVSSDKMLLVGIDSPIPTISGSAPMLSGEARRQAGPFSVASLVGPTIFNMVGVVPEFGGAYPTVNIGQLAADGRGSISGVLDRTMNSLADEALPSLNEAFTASYTVDPDGRALLTNIPSLLSTYKIAYFFDQNKAFLLDADGECPGFGRIEPQDDGPFSEGSVSGRLVAGSVRAVSNDQAKVAGWIVLDQNGGASLALDKDDLGFVGSDILSSVVTSYATGAYTLASNGRGTLNFPSSQDAAAAEVFWVISPNHIVTLGNLEFKQSPD